MKTNLSLFRPEAWSTWKEFTAMQRRMERILDDLAEPYALSEKTLGGFCPACDIEETDNQFSIKVDVPGIPRDKLKVELHGDTLTISGEQREERREEKGKQKLVERYRGHLERSFTLPGIEDAAKIQAEYVDGVLKISVPKGASNRAREILIRDGKSVSAGAKPEEKKQADSRAA